MIKVNIDQEALSISYADSGRWRSFELSTSGTSFDDCSENGSISEIDQDGGEIRTYPLSEAYNGVIEAAEIVINRELNKGSKL